MNVIFEFLIVFKDMMGKLQNQREKEMREIKKKTIIFFILILAILNVSSYETST